MDTESEGRKEMARRHPAARAATRAKTFSPLQSMAHNESPLLQVVVLTSSRFTSGGMGGSQRNAVDLIDSGHHQASLLRQAHNQPTQTHSLVNTFIPLAVALPFKQTNDCKPAATV